MDSSQKRERDRKQRQRRQDKDARRKERKEQKLQRLTTPVPASPLDGAASEPGTVNEVAPSGT